MPRVDFYILPEEGTSERFACDIASKIFRQEMEIYIHAASAHEARMLDDLLWSYRDTSFLPHGLVGDEASSNTITIGWQGNSRDAGEVLINLGPDVPALVEDFERIVEIVPANDADKQRARDRYKSYRKAGFELHNHDLGSDYELN